MPLHKDVAVSSGGIHGRCWFAAEDIPAGTTVWWAPDSPHESELIVTIEEMESWPEEKREKFMALAYQLDDSHMAGFADEESAPYDVIKENYVNHSCDGNCWYDGTPLVTRRDVKKGEELAYDYCLTDAHSTFRLKCLCGTAACRGEVTGNDWKKPELREKYGRHFMPHILALIDAEKEPK